MIIDPSDFDENKYCTRYGYTVRLDGTVDVKPHKYTKWERHSPAQMRRTCTICWAIQSRHSVYKPRKQEAQPKTADNIVNLDEWRAS